MTENLTAITENSSTDETHIPEEEHVIEHVIITGHSRGLGEALARVWMDWGANVLG